MGTKPLSAYNIHIICCLHGFPTPVVYPSFLARESGVTCSEGVFFGELLELLEALDAEPRTQAGRSIYKTLQRIQN